MIKSFFAVTVLACVLAACGSIRVGPDQTIKVGERTIVVVGVDGFNAAALTRPNPHFPNVLITEKEQIVADQEPIRPIDDGSGQIVLTWALDRDSDYVFPDDSAINFSSGTGSSPPPFRCRVPQPRKKVIACLYNRPSGSSKWKYAIMVTNQRTGRALTALDPWIYQD